MGAQLTHDGVRDAQQAARLLRQRGLTSRRRGEAESEAEVGRGDASSTGS